MSTVSTAGGYFRFSRLHLLVSVRLTFRVLVVLGDLLRFSAADGFGVKSLSDVGRVHHERSQNPVLIEYVVDHVAVHLQGAKESF